MCEWVDSMTLGKKNCASDVEGKGEEKSYRSRDSADSCRLTTQKRQGRKGKGGGGKGKEETKQKKKKKVPLPPALGLINGLLGKMEVSESRMFFFFFFSSLSQGPADCCVRTSACGNQGTKRWTAAPLVPAPSAKMSTARLDTCRTRAIDG